ncbi:hypothetical protein WA158_005045 [Blastocystis sp. Blastoise]
MVFLLNNNSILFEPILRINELLCEIDLSTCKDVYEPYSKKIESSSTQKYYNLFIPAINNIYKGDYEDLYALAKCYFKNNEMGRCANIITKIPESNWTSRYLFLWAYATYMDGERKVVEFFMTNEEKKQDSDVHQRNEYLDIIEQRLTESSIAQQDPFCMYILGIVYKRTERISEAIYTFIQSINIYPCIWSVWKDLSYLLKNIKELNKAFSMIQTTLLIKDLFYIFCSNILQNNDVILSTCQSLSLYLPNSLFLLSQKAIALYNNKDFDEASSVFHQILLLDPYRLEYLDIYSNILYIQNNIKDFSILVHQAEQINKYAPETCIILGNYYSLKGQHEDALRHFQRVLKMNPDYSEAWTLMGHEYVELKQRQLAINAYKKAVDHNPRDYRAWFGLGMVYELLQVYSFSLYYYQQANNIRPGDCRILCGLATCYEHLNRMKDCLSYYIQADNAKDFDGMAAYPLGEIYESQGEEEKAAFYYQRYIHKAGQGKSMEKKIHSLRYLVEFYKNHGDDQQAMKIGEQIFALTEDAKIIEDIQNILNNN